MKRSEADPPVGELIRQTLLDSVATYRVCGHQGGLVEVEALDVPGLERGDRLRFTSDAVRAMERIGATVGAAATSQLSQPRLSQA